MEKLKNGFIRLKNVLIEHKKISVTVGVIALAIVVTGVSAAILAGTHAGASVVAGGETTDDIKEPVIMYHSNMIDDGDDIELAEEEQPEEEPDSDMEFEYDGRVINISAGQPVELIPEEELEKKVVKDPGDAVVEITPEDPSPSQRKETTTVVSKPEENTNQENNEISLTKNVYAGDAFAPFGSDIMSSFGEEYTMPSNLVVKNSSGNVVRSFSQSELSAYGQNLSELTFALDSADTYTVHYEFESPKIQVDKAIPGIDVSHWQNDINWSAVAADGYKYAIIKVAGRSIGDDGGLYEDAYFRDNINGALANGLKVGVYFFSQALSVQEAYEEASYILNLIKGYNISYPVVFDWETTAGYRTCDKLSRSELTAICEAFCDTVKSHGYKPMIYMSKNDWLNKVDTNRLASKYNVWLAWYFNKYYFSDDNRLYQDGDDIPDLPFEYNIWQYTSTGRVSGVDGYCDMNVMFTKEFVNGDKITKNIRLEVTPKPTQPPTESDTKPADKPSVTEPVTDTTQADGATKETTDPTKETTESTTKEVPTQAEITVKATAPVVKMAEEIIENTTDLTDKED